MTSMVHFAIGCAAGAVALAAGRFLGDFRLITPGAAVMVLLSGVVVAVASTSRSRFGRAASRAGIYMFFTLAFLEIAYWLHVSSFEPKPAYVLASLLASVAVGAVSYLTATSSNRASR
jgi:drug/metabolite transporter (DMT)-like permease